MRRARLEPQGLQAQLVLLVRRVLLGLQVLQVLQVLLGLQVLLEWRVLLGLQVLQVQPLRARQE